MVVLLLAAIVTALAAPRFGSSNVYDGMRYREELAAAARYAQKRALTSGCPVRLNVTAGGYQLTAPDAFPCSATFVAMPHPANPVPFAGTAPSGVTVIAAPVLPQTVEFDTQGRTDLAADLVISIGANTLTIRRLSGLVE